jgi:hypothetical protein
MSMVYATLTLYSWSLLQLTLNLVSARGRIGAGQAPIAMPEDTAESEFTASSSSESLDKPEPKKSSVDAEVLSVLVTLCMQDAPFFILRMYCIVEFKISSYLFLFFTFKNGILLTLQIYRLISIVLESDKLKRMKLKTLQLERDKEHVTSDDVFI